MNAESLIRRLVANNMSCKLDGRSLVILGSMAVADTGDQIWNYHQAMWLDSVQCLELLKQILTPDLTSYLSSLMAGNQTHVIGIDFRPLQGEIVIEAEDNLSKVHNPSTPIPGLCIKGGRIVLQPTGVLSERVKELTTLVASTDNPYLEPPRVPGSRFSIGDEVRFQPLLDAPGGLLSKIVAVTFTPSKVLYDIALFVEGEFYEVLPLRGVDSVFVQPK